MSYCKSCGFEIKDGAQYCQKCGASVDTGGGYNTGGQYQQYQPYQQPAYNPGMYKQKEAFLALLLSLIIPGLGQMYVGRILRGLIIFLVLPAISIGIWAVTFFTTNMWSDMTGLGFLIFISVYSLVSLAIYIFQLVDAYRLAQEYNDVTLRTGRPPW